MKKTKLVKESLYEDQYSAKSHLMQNIEETKNIIRDYFQNFLQNGFFDKEAYENSAMEGELVDEINGAMFGDDEGIMAGDDESYDFVDKLVDEVLAEPDMEIIKNELDNLTNS